MHCRSRREELATSSCLQGPRAKCTCAHLGLWVLRLNTLNLMGYVSKTSGIFKGNQCLHMFHVAVLDLPLVCSTTLRCPVLPIFAEHVTQKCIGLFNGHLLQWRWTFGIKNCHVFCTNIAAADPCSCKDRTRQRLPSFQCELQNFQSRLHTHIRLARGSQGKIFESWIIIIVVIPQKLTWTKVFLKPFPSHLTLPDNFLGVHGSLVSRSSWVASCQNFTNMDQGSSPTP